MIAVIMIDIFINNYFLQKEYPPVVSFPLYGFLESFGIQYKREKTSCSLLNRIFNDDMHDL